MAHAAGDAHEYPVYGFHFRLIFPLLDADGDLVTGGGSDTPDSERSIDNGTFADCTNEMTEVATSSGMYYLDLTGTEMTGKSVAVIAKTATAGTKTTPMVLYPRRLPVLEAGTATGAGAATTITLAAGASAEDDFYNGLFVGVTSDTPAGADEQIRRIIDYNGTTKVATVDSAWGTNPTTATYDILIPEGYSTVAWGGVKIGTAAARGITDITAILADVTGIAGAAMRGTDDAALASVATEARLAELDAGNLPSDIDAILGDTATTIPALLPAALVGGRMDSNVSAINNVNAAAIRLGLSANQIIPATVDTVTNTHTPTTTEFQADDITEATADHFNGRIVVFTSGVLDGQATDITDYEAVGGIGQFTVTAMTEAPSNNDTFVIV